MFLDPPEKTGDSSKPISMQEYFTTVFEDTSQTKAKNCLSIQVPEHKMKKFYASLALRTLKIQLHHSSLGIVGLVSIDTEILSIFIEIFEKNKAIIWRLSKKSKIKVTCKEPAGKKKKKKKKEKKEIKLIR